MAVSGGKTCDTAMGVKMKKSWIICLSIVLILAVGVIGAGKLFFDWMRVEVIKLQTSEAEYSWVNQKPLKVELAKKGDFQGVIEALGISLGVPWKDMRLIKEDNNLCTFQSEDFRISISKESELFIQDFINSVVGHEKSLKFYSYLTGNYGKRVICSHYEFDKVVLNTVQHDLEHVHSDKKMDMFYILLVIKCQLTPLSAQTGLYHFENDSIRGFQFGTGNAIMLWVYNSKGEKYQIDISRKIRPNIKITKSVLEEVSGVLPTIKFINGAGE